MTGFRRTIGPGHLCLAGGAVVWSTGGVIVKAALVDVHPFAIAVMGSFQLGLGWFLFTRGVQAVNSQEAGIITLLESILNPNWVAIVVREVPNGWTMAGGGLIVAALVLRYTVMAPGPVRH